MASGDIAHVDPASLPVGAAVTSSGRVSAALWPRQAFDTPPFSQDDLILLDDTLKETSEVALVRFAVYIGDLGTDVVEGARAALAEAPEPYNAALLAVSPNSRDVVVVSGSDVAGRVNDRVAELGVQAALSSIKQGELIDGLVSALRVMATAVARP
ncbi:DUF5130 family protein [Gordonia sp. MP11Mi]|uniref:DUF5130 domain-containing protein n=1 Tax=Gordonia sp. MP11Mi TaxID=3022769 RepID=A0AA97CTV1_9ACTN